MRDSHGAATSAAPGLPVEVDPPTPEVDLVIVGGGPRAVATVARLAARLRPDEPFGAPAPPGDPALRVAIIDAVQVGAGATWRTDQHPLLLNNTYSAQTTAHADASTDQDGPLVPGPDLVQWAAACSHAPTQRYLGIGPERPAWLGAELAALRPESYPTRRLQGVYYRDQLAEAARRGGIEVWHIEGTATDIAAAGTGLATRAHETADPTGNGTVERRRLVRLAGAHRVAVDGPRGHRAQHPEPVAAISAPMVVLAQGMIQAEPSDQTRARTDRARKRRLLYMPPGMPSERDWTEVPGDGQDVLVAGMGANFFDVIGILTAGRGGRFTLADTGAQVDAAGFAAVDGGAGGAAAGAPLHYEPSGAEPRLLVGSRRGLPYRGKGAYPTGMPPPWRPRIATAGALADACRGGVADLRALVWPLLAAEFAAAHLITLAAHHRHAVVEGVDEAAIVAALSRGANPTAVVADLVTAPGYALDLDRLDRPAPVSGPQQWDDWVRTWLDQEQASIANPLTSPRNAVNRAMATLRVLLGRHVAAGALDGRARLVQYEDWFVPLGLTLASGPPPRRTAQLLALVRAGVVQLLGEGLVIDPDDDGFRARTRVHPGGVVARALLETRMSRGQLPGTSDPLLSALMGSARARLHRVPDASSAGGWAATTSVDVTPEGFALIDAAGRADPDVLVLGIPAEAVQPGSAIGATPGVPSPLLAGADRVAARALERIAVPV
ncbi:FAD/NAD(P)-binding protein [Pseudactinotalea sp. Z1748]|uniref:FAD/NAD(P)-binding protein n=1 Tax=Pseudactinotalea sp. Z1748 TaxID=3413027 RepID=UPI003C79815C